MTDRQVEKIRFIDDLKVLHSDFAPHQLEVDLGGTAPTAQKFLPFPIPPGPFEVGCRSGPDANAVKDVHRVLTAEGARGRLWDPALSETDNKVVDYSDLAAEIFQRCKLPPPPPRPKRQAKDPPKSPFFPHGLTLPDPEGEVGVSKEAAVFGQADEDSNARGSPRWPDDSTLAGDSSFLSDEDGRRKKLAEVIDTETIDVFSPMIFSCMVCRCTVGLKKKVNGDS
jgi:hypothetical protein